MKVGAVFQFCLFLSAVQGVPAEESLTVNQAVARNIAPGDTHRFSISLNDRRRQDSFIDLSEF
jgi:hypothetical protein